MPGSPPLSEDAEVRIARLFGYDEAPRVRALLLERCGHNLPFLDKLDSAGMDRFRFAVLKLSEGRFDKLERALREAETDWRDLLMAAGFGHDVHAHRSWMPARR